MKNKMKNLAGTVLIAAIPLLVTSCSSTPSTSSSQDTSAGGAEIVRGRVILDAATETATVQSIDKDTRTVVLLHGDGTTSSYECGPDVRNFDQIKVGDQVTATVSESVAIGLIKGGVSPGAGTATAVVRSPLGDKPAGKIVDTVGFIAKVVSIDPSTRMVTLQTPDGQNQTLKVGPDVDLTGVNPGDDVGVKVTRAFAVSVTSPNGAP
ncbi:MAG TPA: hypothetical protein VMH87_12470 [Pseudomonadales bacterium]|nr:hypothetical protein [Pseudomonadales bacterium]